MSEDQENVPPMTRLPRLATPTKASLARAIPVPTTRPLGTATSVASNNAGKRKTPTTTGAPPAKRPAVGGPAARPATRSSTGSGGASHGMSTRRSSGANSSTGSANGARARKPPIPPRTAAPRPAPRNPTARVPVVAKKPAAATATAPRTLSAGGPSRAPVRPPARKAAPEEPIGDNRMANVETILEFLKEETAKISANQKNLDDRQAQARAAEAKEHEARRGLSASADELREMRAAHLQEVDELERQILAKEREKSSLEEELRERSEKLSEERQVVRELRQELSSHDNKNSEISAQLSAAQIRNDALQGEVERATLAVSAMKAELATKQEEAQKKVDDAEQRVLDALAERDARIAGVEAELRAAETIRRKLHNMVQELKGNIRVFARVRPPLPHEINNPEGLAGITYGDERLAAETGQSHLTVVSRSESAMGKEREQISQFTFDKVFHPKHGQQDVFEEISMLAQSVLDGYNVCIFAYGQTGSGKSWTMEGGDTPDTRGMIPRAIEMIFDVSKQLHDRGWKYEMEGSFLEVYNDVINDLLGTSQWDTKKHEIKIDKDNRMTVTDTVSLPLSNPNEVSKLLATARGRRAVAATLMNERSSRSHSVFALKVKGVNAETGEVSEGVLNLVDLAGSERLANSGAGENKERLKETININKSLSALADVIGALGQGQQGGHVPYRNSTLTRLLQTSLSGSSKTLMLCNLSPLAAHLGETVCTLRFATKVNSTPAGTARRSLAKS